MTTAIAAAPIQSQGLRDCMPYGHRGKGAWAKLCCFPRPYARSWIRSGACGTADKEIGCHATAPPFKYAFYMLKIITAGHSESLMIFDLHFLYIHLKSHATNHILVGNLTCFITFLSTCKIELDSCNQNPKAAASFNV